MADEQESPSISDAITGMVAGMHEYASKVVRGFAEDNKGNIKGELIAVHVVNGIPRYVTNDGVLIITFTYSVMAYDPNLGLALQGDSVPVFAMGPADQTEHQRRFENAMKEAEKKSKLH